MIKLKLLVFSLILLGPCAFAYAKKGSRVGGAMPAALCAQSIALIFFGYALPFSAGVGILAALSAAAWIYALAHIRNWRAAGVSLFVPCLIFACSAVFLYDACSRRLFLSYDEYSHWGMIVKAISLFDELPRAGRGAAYIQFTYPPATAMLPSMASTLLGYRDGVAYFGYAMLIEGLLWGLASRVSRGVKTIAASALIYLCMMAVFPLGMIRLFAEPVIALLIVLLILGAFEEGTDGGIGDCLLAVMLAMTKNTGVLYVVMVMAIRLCVRPDRRQAARALRVLLCALAGAASYMIYCSAAGISAVVSPSHFAENMAALFSGTLEEAYAGLPARYIQFLFGAPLAQSGVYSCYGFGTSAVVLGVVLLMGCAHVSVARDRRQALRLWGGVWVVNLLYMAMIVASYFFSFEPEEVARLAEADRYTMLIALWTGLLACAMLVRERETLLRRRRLVLLCCLTAALLPLSHMEMTVKTFITRDYVYNTIWARAATDEMTAYIKGELAAQDDPKLLCMGEYNYIELHYTLAGDVDIGTMEKSWQYASWTGSCEMVEAELANGKYDYVFVANTESEDAWRAIDERYAPLTADGGNLAPYSLYRVEHGGEGEITLSYMSTMSEQE